MAYESVYEDKQEKGLFMIGPSICMPLGLSISYVHHIAQPIPELGYNEAVEEIKWRILAVPRVFTALTFSKDSFKKACLCYFQRLANGHGTEA